MFLEYRFVFRGFGFWGRGFRYGVESEVLLGFCVCVSSSTRSMEVWWETRDDAEVLYSQSDDKEHLLDL